MLASITGVDFTEAWRRRVEGQLLGVPVYYIDIDSLIKNKLASGRHIDLHDAEQLQLRKKLT